jgi:O-antigen/teichoic acid export membrane protein
MNLRGRLLSQSTVIFGSRIAGAGLVVGVQAAIARMWGSQILGEYLLIIAAVNLLAMVMPLGFNTVGTYFAAEYRARQQGQLLWQFLLRSYAHVLFAGAGLGLVFLVVSILWADQLPDIVGYWMPATLLAVAVATIFINGAVLVGLKRPYAGFFADGLVRPVLVIAAFVLATGFAAPPGRLNVMLWVFALGYALIALGHLGLVIRTVQSLPVNADPAEGQSNRWWRFAAPWVLIALASGFFFDIDLILLSALMGKETLAVFGVSTRIFSLLTFGISAVYAVSLPDMFEAAARSENTEFHRRIGDANLVAAGLSVVLFLGVILGGPLILWVFGPDFVAGTIPLAILSLVLVVRSVFGPGELVLSIQDRPWASLPAIGLGLVILVIGNLALVPLWGLTGAALAALLAFSVWSVTLWWTVLRTTGLNVSIFPRLLELWTRSRSQEQI